MVLAVLNIPPVEKGTTKNNRVRRLIPSSSELRGVTW
jgi:hypothetical protein